MSEKLSSSLIASWKHWLYISFTLHGRDGWTWEIRFINFEYLYKILVNMSPCLGSWDQSSFFKRHFLPSTVKSCFWTMALSAVLLCPFNPVCWLAVPHHSEKRKKKKATRIILFWCISVKNIKAPEENKQILSFFFWNAVSSKYMKSLVSYNSNCIKTAFINFTSMINFQTVGTSVFWEGCYPLVTTKTESLNGQSSTGLPFDAHTKLQHILYANIVSGTACDCDTYHNLSRVSRYISYRHTLANTHFWFTKTHFQVL